MKQKDQRSSKKEQEVKVQVNQTDELSNKKLTMRQMNGPSYRKLIIRQMNGQSDRLKFKKKFDIRQMIYNRQMVYHQTDG